MTIVGSGIETAVGTDNIINAGQLVKISGISKLSEVDTTSQHHREGV